MTHGGNIFAAARAGGWDWREVLDFSASINPLGPAPGVFPAIRAALERVAHYPEPEPLLLREALSQEWRVKPEQIVLGNGATELIFFAARMFAAHPATLALPVFSEFQRAFPQARCARLEDPRSWPDNGLFVFTRPANPTGVTIALETLRAYLELSAAHVLIDESFLEFSNAPSATAFLDEFPRLAVLRSLTKFYALPGLRVGALLGSLEAAQAWRNAREPWQVNVLAEAAALAALRDRDHAARTRAFLHKERAWLAEQLQVPSTDANFLYVPLPYPAAGLCQFLRGQKILIRDCSAWPGLTGEAVRVAVKRRDENERLLSAWRQFPCA